MTVSASFVNMQQQNAGITTRAAPTGKAKAIVFLHLDISGAQSSFARSPVTFVQDQGSDREHVRLEPHTTVTMENVLNTMLVVMVTKYVTE